ncbi:hypothetical protein RJ641_024269 [Dillenia turbinata]|uniref:Uncharacterized protein n=1 Tax=Dillenia turbinata TaxID=194707 RepID=A0AAN8UJB1_9MAGN
MKTPAQNSASPIKKCPRIIRCTCLRNMSAVPMKVVTRRYYGPDPRSGFLEEELTFEIPPHQVVLVHHAAYKRSPDITVLAHVYPKIRTSPHGDEVFPTTPIYGEDLYPNGTPDAKIIRANFDSYDLMMKKEIRLAFDHEDNKVRFQSDERKLPRHISFCFCGKLNEPMEETEARARGILSQMRSPDKI